jgi:hypothetical protein
MKMNNSKSKEQATLNMGKKNTRKAGNIEGEFKYDIFDIL